MPSDPIQDFVNPFRWRQEVRARLEHLQEDIDAIQQALLVQQATVNRMSTMVDNVMLVSQEILEVCHETLKVLTGHVEDGKLHHITAHFTRAA